MLTNEMNDLIGSLRVHNGVLIMGAGASLKAGMPLYAQFPMLMWKVVEENPEIKEELGSHRDVRARDIIGNKTDMLIQTFRYVAKYPSAIDSFKEQFKNLTNKHNQSFSEVHENICRLIHEGFIKLVISLNWDDLLEVAWNNLYGTEINGDFVQLIKPHGDVRNLDSKWTLPHEPGYVSPQDKELISEILQDDIFTYWVLGYSENDKTIVEEIINPKENQNLFFRVSPGNQIDLDAADATRILVEHLIEDSEEIWNRIDYSNQNGMERALLGYRLLPSDVEASARLPQIHSAHLKLDQINYVLIEAEPGCGKSITAYQIGYDYKNENWEIFKLNNSVQEKNIRHLFNSNRYRSVYIIDDAQQFSMSFIEKCINATNSRRKIIITRTQTNDSFSRETITIAKKDSIKAIKEHYLKHSKKLIPLLNSNYKGTSIGNLHMETPFERLIEYAAKEETPWLFNYNLSEGWKRLQEKFSLIQEHKRSDIILVLIAVKQIVQLDKAIDYSWLSYSTSSFPDIKTTLDDALAFLELEDCITINNEGIRTIHLQLAREIVLLYWSKINYEERKQLVKFIQNDVLKTKPDLLGLVWFSNLTFRGHYEISNMLYSNDLCLELIHRCFIETSPEGKRDALLLLDKINRYNLDYGYNYLLKFERSNLIFLVENITFTSLRAAGDLLNNMYNCNKSEKEKFVLELNLDIFFKLVKSLKIGNSFGLGHFIDRLGIGMKKSWLTKFSAEFPKKEVMNLIEESNRDEFWLISDICSSIAMINEELAEEFFPLLLDKLIHAFHYSVSKTLEDIDHQLFYLFFGREILGKRRLSKKNREHLIRLSERVNYKHIVISFNESKPREWRNLEELLSDLSKVDQKLVKKIILEIDLEYIENQLNGLWSIQPDDFDIVRVLSSVRPKEISDLLYTHKDEMNFLRPPYATLNVALVEGFLSEDKEVRLFEEKRFFWDYGAETIKFYGRKNTKIGLDILNQNKEKLSKIFLLIEPIDWEASFLLFFEIAKVYPNFLKQLSNEIDLEYFLETNRVYFSKEILGRMNYSGNRSFENINGFKKMINLVIENTDRLDLITELQRILNLIISAEKELPKKYSTLSIEI